MSEGQNDSRLDAVVEQLKALNENLSRLYVLQLMEFESKRVKGQYQPNTYEAPLTESLLTWVANATKQVNKIAK